MTSFFSVADRFGSLQVAIVDMRLSLVLLIVTAILVAIVLHAAVFFVLRGTMDSKGPGRVILARIWGVTRLASVLLSLVVILPAVDFDPAVTELTKRGLNIGMAVLLGWSAVLGVNAAANWIERQNRLDVDDNLSARRVHTQIGILKRIAIVVVVIVSAGAILVTFPSVRAYGFSLFASAGVAGLVIGLAARPILTNLFAGMQIALTQPIRIDDVVIVEGEWGWIEEITATYVVVRIWDLRRLIVPLSFFIEKPFENWTRESSAIIGTVFWHVDYRTPIDLMREQLKEIVERNDLWDGKVANLQVVDSGQTTLTIRALVSAQSSPKAWDLRCQVREAMLLWLQSEHPEALPRVRASVSGDKLKDPAIAALSN